MDAREAIDKVVDSPDTDLSTVCDELLVAPCSSVTNDIIFLVEGAFTEANYAPVEKQKLLEQSLSCGFSKRDFDLALEQMIATKRIYVDEDKIRWRA